MNRPVVTDPLQSPAVSRRYALAVLAAGAAGALAACTSASRTAPTAPTTEPAPAAQIVVSPARDATDVAPTAAIGVQVSDGWLQHVTLRNPQGKAVTGVLNSERTSFHTTEPLGYGQRYTWTGSVVGRDGVAAPIAASFTTVSPDTKVSGEFQLADGQVVGIAAPVILQFDAAIDDAAKPDVERALTINTTPPVEGSWAWLPDEAQGSRVHWRPRDYYPAGTTVHVAANVYGVPFGDGGYGAQDSTLDFTIGRRQIVKADATTHRIQVLTDAGVIMDLPSSYGEGDLPRNITRSGIHVVTEKHADFYMSNPAAGYTNAHERWAVRISNNGEFIHANPSTTGEQGSSNVTNGCINLSTDNAKQYFDSALYGDPVEVTGTPIPLSSADGDIWDWAVDWDTWTAMSALHTSPVGAAAAPTPRPGG